MFLGVKGCLGYIFFQQKSLGGTKQVRVSWRVPFDKYNLMPSPMAHVRILKYKNIKITSICKCKCK